MSLSQITQCAKPFGLFVMGTLHECSDTLVLLGAGARVWPQFKASREYSDGQPDPLDRWSKRVVGGIADQFGAQTHYPSDGPPYAPFIRWAEDTGQFFQSPTGMLVHPVAGLMISIRAALRLPGHWPANDMAAQNPCDNCPDRPCTTACPVGALAADHAYDVPACKAYLDTPPGADCMSNGCKARRACPVSAAFDRDPEQSAFHMLSFIG